MNEAAWRMVGNRMLIFCKATWSGWSFRLGPSKLGVICLPDQSFYPAQLRWEPVSPNMGYIRYHNLKEMPAFPIQ